MSFNVIVSGISGSGTSAQDSNINPIGVNIEHFYNGPQAKKQKFESVQFGLRKPFENFTGRENELKVLHNKLQNETEQVVITQIISGLGGIGKTELAIKYANDYKGYYDGNVIWINAETQESLKNSFHKLAKGALKFSINEMKDGKEEEKDIKSIVEDLYRHFSNRKSLFIFDNAEELKSIKDFLPIYFNAHVLITSRNREWKSVMDLGVFSLEEAVKFIRKALEFKNDDLLENDIKQLADELQCYPLALRQATSYIRVENKKRKRRGGKKFSISDYLEEYEKKAESLLAYQEPDYVLDLYSKTTLITWKVTIENIEKRDCGKEALNILNIMAYIAPNWINIKEVFSRYIIEDKLWDAAELLDQYALIDLLKGEANIHRLVQQVIRIQLKREGLEENILGKALELLYPNITNKHDLDYMVDHRIIIWNYASEYDGLIDQYIDLDPEWGNVLYFLSLHGCSEAVISILRNIKKKDLNIFYLYANICLCDAVRLDDLELVKYLVEKGADLRTCDEDDQTPFEKAIYEGRCDVMEYLLEKINYFRACDKYGMTPLHYAADCGRLDAAKYIVEKGADIRACDKYGMTPLHYAADYFDGFFVMKYLVDNGADIRACDNDGKTPLHYVADNRISSDIILDKVKYLVEKGADFRACDKNGKTSLHSAAARSLNLVVVKYLVEKGADIQACDNNGKTPLHYAAGAIIDSNLDVVKYLVEKGADFRAYDNNGKTPLHYAAAEDHKVHVAIYLVENGADFQVCDNDGKTPFQIAASMGRWGVVKYLVEKGADFRACDKDDWTFLHTAVCWNCWDIVEFLLEKGVDFRACNKNGMTLLHYAASSGELDVVKYLVEKGADFRVCDNDGETPLHTAASSGKLDVVKYLVEKGANFRACDNDGKTPLHIADVSSFDSSVAKYLIEIGADFRASDKFGRTLLHCLVARSFNLDLDLMKYLVGNGADFLACDNTGKTPLHYAAAGSFSLDFVKYFVERGANFHAFDKEGKTPLHYAAADKYSLPAVVKYLVEKGADLRVCDNYGKTSLHYAVAASQSGELEVVKYLVEKGADLLACDKDGKTLLHYAAAAKFEELDLVKYLVEKGADFQACDKDGKAPLHYAVDTKYRPNGLSSEYPHWDVAKYLVEKGADFRSCNIDGEALLHYAAKSGQLRVVKCLVEKGADFLACDKDGWTPLHFARDALEKSDDDYDKIFHLKVVKYLEELEARTTTI